MPHSTGAGASGQQDKLNSLLQAARQAATTTERHEARNALVLSLVSSLGPLKRFKGQSADDVRSLVAIRVLETVDALIDRPDDPPEDLLAYCRRTVSRAIRQAAMERSIVAIPKHRLAQLRQIGQAVEEFRRLGTLNPTDEQIAHLAGVSASAVAVCWQIRLDDAALDKSLPVVPGKMACTHLDVLAAPVLTPEEELLRDEGRARLLRGFRALMSEAEWKVFAPAFGLPIDLNPDAWGADRLTDSQIAERLGITPAAVNSRKRSALARLRAVPEFRDQLRALLAPGRTSTSTVRPRTAPISTETAFDQRARHAVSTRTRTL